jgi:hypothetical protein
MDTLYTIFSRLDEKQLGGGKQKGTMEPFCSIWWSFHRMESKGPPQTAMMPGKRKVAFSPTVEIHHHKLILGDHPSVSEGIPLTLDWSVEYSEAIDLDAHESRCRNGLPLFESSEREEMARHHGASDQCLLETRKELSLIQTSRRLSELDQPWGLWGSMSDSSHCYQQQRCGILLTL